MTRWILRTAMTLPSAITFASASAARSAEFDLSPQQVERIRVKRDPAAVSAIPNNFSFVSAGTLTVAVSPGGPPLATYATDAQTVVGARAMSRSAVAVSHIGFLPPGNYSDGDPVACSLSSCQPTTTSRMMRRQRSSSIACHCSVLATLGAVSRASHSRYTLGIERFSTRPKADP